VAMCPGHQARLAHNEDSARKVNESIDQERAEDDGPGPRWFVCECAEPDCAELVDVGAERYHEVRANPRQFVVLRGHEDPSVETVVGSHASFVIVEKTGEAGRVAEEDAET
jgi:hypothetical protein